MSVIRVPIVESDKKIQFINITLSDIKNNVKYFWRKCGSVDDECISSE